jgi:hypothetical protein
MLVRMHPCLPWEPSWMHQHAVHSYHYRYSLLCLGKQLPGATPVGAML